MASVIERGRVVASSEEGKVLRELDAVLAVVAVVATHCGSTATTAFCGYSCHSHADESSSNLALVALAREGLPPTLPTLPTLFSANLSLLTLKSCVGCVGMDGSCSDATNATDAIFLEILRSLVVRSLGSIFPACRRATACRASCTLSRKCALPALLPRSRNFIQRSYIVWSRDLISCSPIGPEGRLCFGPIHHSDKPFREYPVHAAW